MTAIQIDHTPAAITRGKVSHALLDIGHATMVTLAGWWRRRRAMRQLSGADDFLLRDIGLTRGSIESAVRHGRR